MEASLLAAGRSPRPRVEPGEHVEERGNVVAEVRITGKKTDVGIYPRGDRVVVSGRDVDVTPQTLALTADNQGCLAVGFPANESEYGVDARFLHLPRQIDVRFFVEPGLQLDDRSHLLAVLSRPPQRSNNGRVLSDPIERLLDREHVGIIGGRVEEVHNHCKRVVRVVQEHVPFANDCKNILVGGESLRDTRVERRVLVRGVDRKFVERQENRGY